jgi:hypothetical protein
LLTHDVDRIHFRDAYFLAGNVLTGLRRPHRLAELVRLFSSSSSILGGFESICNLESKYGAVSTYFFLSEPYRLRRYNSRYSKKFRLLPGIFRLIDDADSEIGLHGSYYSFDGADYSDERWDLEEIAGKPVIANRNHYLRFEPSRTPAGLAGSGIRLDTTLGFPDANRFRNGSSHAFRWYDIESDSLLPVLEVPMVFMDTIAFDRGESEGNVIEEISRILKRVSKQSGTVSLLFHYDILSESRTWFRIYERTLDMASSEGFAFVRPTELVERYGLNS